jgi:hypothetical protein
MASCFDGGVAVWLSESPCVVRCHSTANGEVRQMWRFSRPVERLVGSSSFLGVVCCDGSMWIKMGSATAEEAAKRQRVDAPAFSPFLVSSAESCFARVEESLEKPLSCLAASARDAEMLVCVRGEMRLVDARGVRLLSKTPSNVVAAAQMPSDGRWLCVMSDGAVHFATLSGLGAEVCKLSSAAVFVGSVLDMPVLVCESGTVLQVQQGAVIERHLGCQVASCSLAGSALVVLSPDALAPPLVVDLAAEGEELVPRMISADTPGLVAVHAHAIEDGKAVVVLGVPSVAAGLSLLVRRFSSAAALSVTCRRGDCTDSVRDAVQALAEQAAVHERLKEQHIAANARLVELNQAVHLRDQIAGTAELAVNEDGSIGLRATIRNLSAFEISTRWSVCLTLGARRVHFLPLLRGIKKGCYAVVSCPDVVFDSYCALDARLWLVHSFADESPDLHWLPSVRFHAGRNLSVLLHSVSFNPLDLCWIPRNPNQMRATAPKRPSAWACRVHAQSRRSGDDGGEQRTTFRLVLNNQHLEGCNLVTGALESPFGAGGSLTVRPSGAGVSEVMLTLQSAHIGEAVALRAAIARRIASRVSESAKARNSDWRGHRAALAALAHRIDAKEHPMQIHADLRQILASIL